MYDYDSGNITGQKSDWIRTLTIFIQFHHSIKPQLTVWFLQLSLRSKNLPLNLKKVKI